MATLMEIPCPECEKLMKLPEEMAGKKVRCKGCGHVFRVEEDGKAGARPVKSKPPPKAKSAAKGKPDPKAGKGKPSSGDDEGDGNPYGLTDEYLGPRCPFCALPMEEGDVICLECGYNTQTRVKTGTKKVFERTGTDWFLWLCPAIMCVITILSLIAFDVWYYFWVPTDQQMEDFAVWILGMKGVKLWVTIGTFFAMFFCTIFAFKRLVLNPIPPEREKKDSRNIFVILGTLILGILMLLATIGAIIGLLLNGYIPNPWLFGMLLSASYGMIGGALQYNV